VNGAPAPLQLTHYGPMVMAKLIATRMSSHALSNPSTHHYCCKKWSLSSSFC